MWKRGVQGVATDGRWRQNSRQLHLCKHGSGSHQDRGNKFEISGSVDYLSDARVKQEFHIDEDVNHVVAIKVCNCSGNKTNKDEVEIMVNGVRNYDAEHLNGDDYTFIILEANAGTTVTVSVKWNASMEPQVYTIKMADNLQLKSAT